MEKIVESDPQVVKNWLQNIFVGITIPQTGFMSNWLNIFPHPHPLKRQAQGSVPVGTARDGLLLQGEGGSEGSAGNDASWQRTLGEVLMETTYGKNIWGHLLEIMGKNL